jgi:hypothetical protein
MDITQIVSLVIAVLGLVLTGIFMPYVKSKASTEQLELIYKAVKIAVYAAEQLFGSGMGIKKKQYVIEYLASKGLYVNEEIISSDLNAMIESAVYELTKEQEKNE